MLQFGTASRIHSSSQPGKREEEEEKKEGCSGESGETETQRESIITVDSGRLCSGPVAVSYAGMAAGRREWCAALTKQLLHLIHLLSHSLIRNDLGQ